ncbi:hypothetical protein H4R24_001827 [Coemansia sp. RSA 988]|nr:hypothetical protein H4R24_001827 [Coemansia sp. RSA 988]
MNGPDIDSIGPNAPLLTRNALGSMDSIESSIKRWTVANWPIDKLVLGLPFYGTSAIVKANLKSDQISMYAQRESKVPKGDWNDKEISYPDCSEPAVYTGNWKYRNLRVSALTGPDKEQKDWKYFWDEESQTPWLYNAANKTFISYDNPKSITAKVKFVSELGLAGAMVWSVDMDFKEELVDAMQSWPKETDKTEPDEDDPNTDKCTIEFQSSCPDKDGTTATYTTCIGGIPIPRLCPAGTVCYKENNGIKCDYLSVTRGNG